MPPLIVEAFVGLNLFMDGGHDFRIGSRPAIVLRLPGGRYPGLRFN
jgi:hypothetical protein